MSSLTIHEKKLPLVIEVNMREVKNISGTRNQILKLTKDLIRKYYTKYLSNIYGIFSRASENKYYIMFIEIVVGFPDPMMKKLASELYNLCKNSIQETTINSIEILESIDSLFYNDNQDQEDDEKRINFEIAPSKKTSDGEDIEIDSFTQIDLMKYQKRDPTENKIYLSMNRYDYVIDLFKTLDNGYELFRKNILIFCSAYMKYHNDQMYEDRKHSFVDKNDWIKFAVSFSATAVDAQNAFFEATNFAYTILTLEEILRNQSPVLCLKIDKFNRELFTHNVRNLLLSSDEISYDNNCMLFSEYIRRDHFYADKLIYVFDGRICIPTEPARLTKVAKKFANEVKSIKDMILLEDSGDEDADRSKTNATLFTRCSAIMNPFLGKNADTLIRDACAKYLSTDIKKGTWRNAVAFKDMAVVYSVIDGEKTLTRRKCYMEDHFMFTTDYDLAEFGKLPEEQQAIKEVKETYKKMFVYDEQVEFWMAWLGSIYTRDPERCALFMYGKNGENAKTSITSALIESLGLKKYGHQYTSHMFYHSGKGNQTCEPFWADVEGALVGSVPEANGKSFYSSTAFKEATGGDFKSAAAKNKNPITFKHTAKIVISGNDWIKFDEFGKAVQSRLYPLRCIAEFKKDASLVPKTEKEQHERHIYHEEKNYWTTLRKRAQLYLSLTECFEIYKKKGLIRTKIMEEDLKEWMCATSDYAKFALDLEEENAEYTFKTKAFDLCKIFIKKYSKNNSNLDLETFIAELQNITGYVPHDHNGSLCYNFKHRESTNYEYFPKGLRFSDVDEKKELLNLINN